MIVECGKCYADFNFSEDVDVFDEAAEHECLECGATNFVTADRDGSGEPYVCGWLCKHGLEDNEECEDCNAEADLGIRG